MGQSAHASRRGRPALRLVLPAHDPLLKAELRDALRQQTRLASPSLVRVLDWEDHGPFLVVYSERFDQRLRLDSPQKILLRVTGELIQGLSQY
jgi:hypothetical protein